MEEKEITTSRIYLKDTLTTFLASSLNVELVHVILTAISKCSGKVTDGSNYATYKE